MNALSCFQLHVITELMEQPSSCTPQLQRLLAVAVEQSNEPSAPLTYLLAIRGTLRFIEVPGLGPAPNLHPAPQLWISSLASAAGSAARTGHVAPQEL